jgi:Cu/Ag efflux protein CusF
MTMTFAARGPTQLRGLKPGDTVSFRFVQEDKSPRITAITKTNNR